MGTITTVTPGAERQALMSVKRIIVAYDFSIAADRALADAIALARVFHAEVLIAHVDTPEASAGNAASGQGGKASIRYRMEEIRRRVTMAGHACRELLRTGDVANTLLDLGCEHQGDLLLIGAYGNGSSDRLKLGSTAESLLRSTNCPVLTYGPRFCMPLFQDSEPASILLPLELPCDPGTIAFAARIAMLFNARLEVLHVVDTEHAQSMPDAAQNSQYLLDQAIDDLRKWGVHAGGSVLFGQPAAIIVAKSLESHNSLLLLPLETRARLSSTYSDNVAAQVIRVAQVPVMTFRLSATPDRVTSDTSCWNGGVRSPIMNTAALVARSHGYRADLAKTAS